MTTSHATFTPEIPLTGTQYTSTVTTANGTAIFFMKGILRPFGFFERSERFAMSGSVTASKILPAAVIAPMMVSAPKITSPCGMNSVCPFAIDSWFGR